MLSVKPEGVRGDPNPETIPHINLHRLYDGLPKKSVLCRMVPTFGTNGLIVAYDPDAALSVFMM